VSRRHGACVMVWLLAVAALSPAPAQEVSLRASVDRATVRENESFVYLLRAEGQVRGEPDLTPLTRAFDILQSSRNTSIQMAGGQTSRVTEWSLQLMPRGDGRFTLPPVELDGAFANPVQIEVLPAVEGDAPGDVFLEAEVSPSSTYVQSQVIYTVRLYRGVSIGRSTLSLPEVSGGEAIVEQLGDDRQYQTVREGRNFMALERRYAIFPQAAGVLTIGPVTFDAMVIGASGLSSLQRFRAQPLEVSVAAAVPPPPGSAQAVWLPARRLSLDERWSAGAEALTAGVPQTRTLIVEADGVLETQLPEFSPPEAPGIRQYSDQPELTRDVTATGMAARRVERYAVIAQSGGEFTLPAVELPWFNVLQGAWEVARLPSRSVRVLPSAEQVTDASAPPPVAGETPAPVINEGVWKKISAGLLIAWLSTVALWWRRARRSIPTVSRAPAPPRRESNRRLLSKLREACRRNDGARARALLLRWGELRFPADPPQTLGALAAVLPEALADAVAQLERHLYGPTQDRWDGEPLRRALARVDSLGQPRDEADGEALLPLYR